MNVLKNSSLVLGLAACLAMTACVEQPQRGPRYGERVEYTRGGPQRCGQCGVVQDIQQVYVQKDSSPGGAVLGAIIGGVLGSTIGKGDGRTAATLGGAVAGGFAGNAVGKNNGQDVGFQVVVRLDDGRRATVTQREDPQLRPGDYVEVSNDHVYRR